MNLKKHQISQNNTTVTQKKKNYSKPVLTVLGKVPELTTGGSVKKNETHPGAGGYDKAPRT